MGVALSTRFPQLPGETLRAKAAQLTVSGCFLAGGVLLLASAWDEFSCRAGERTSSGPCGIGLPISGVVVFVGLTLTITGSIVFVRALLRPVDPAGADGWRTFQAFVVMACGGVYALMIPRYSCPTGTTLTPVFRFCVNTEHSFRAESTGMPWKITALVVGIAIGIVMLRWQSMPWWLATAIVVPVFLGAVVVAVVRSTDLPGTQRQYEIGAGTVEGRALPPGYVIRR